MCGTVAGRGEPKPRSGWDRKRKPGTDGRCGDEPTPARQWASANLEEAKPTAAAARLRFGGRARLAAVKNPGAAEDAPWPAARTSYSSRRPAPRTKSIEASVPETAGGVFEAMASMNRVQDQGCEGPNPMSAAGVGRNEDPARLRVAQGAGLARCAKNPATNDRLGRVQQCACRPTSAGIAGRSGREERALLSESENPQGRRERRSGNVRRPAAPDSATRLKTLKGTEPQERRPGGLQSPPARRRERLRATCRGRRCRKACQRRSKAPRRPDAEAHASVARISAT